MERATITKTVIVFSKDNLSFHKFYEVLFAFSFYFLNFLFLFVMHIHCQIFMTFVCLFFNWWALLGQHRR